MFNQTNYDWIRTWTPNGNKCIWIMFVNLFKRDTESVVAGKLLCAWPDTASASEDDQYGDDGHGGDGGDVDIGGDGDDHDGDIHNTCLEWERSRCQLCRIRDYKLSICIWTFGHQWYWSQSLHNPWRYKSPSNGVNVFRCCSFVSEKRIVWGVKMSELPSFAGDVVLDVRVHPALGEQTWYWGNNQKEIYFGLIWNIWRTLIWSSTCKNGLFTPSCAPRPYSKVYLEDNVEVVKVSILTHIV